MSTVIFGCGDVGRRIAKQLMARGVSKHDIQAYVRSVDSAELCARLNVLALKVDLDDIRKDLGPCHDAYLHYTVPPQKSGVADERTQALLEQFDATRVKPKKVVLISTTGVYGDCQGEWVTEASPTKPQTDRGKRRLNMEQQWLTWGKHNRVSVVVLRVPGIYAFSRLPRERLAKRTPVVAPDECGYTNRIHADDLALACVQAMELGVAGEVFNATDGTPGKISDYLQVAAHVLGMDPLPEISLKDAQKTLSEGMLSYLGESRKISNQKMLNDLDVELRYPNFKAGIKE